MNWRRQWSAAGALAASAVAGTYALAAIVPGGLAVTESERAMPEQVSRAPAAVAAFGWSQRNQGSAPSASAVSDAGVFATYCAACHGAGGRGVDSLGVDLTESAFVRAADDGALLEFLRAGRGSDDPANRTGRPMPGFDWLPAETLEEVVRAVRSL